MLKIEAIIQPSKLDAVKDALLEAGIEGMTRVVFRRTVTLTNIERVLWFGRACGGKWKSTTAI